MKFLYLILILLCLCYTGCNEKPTQVNSISGVDIKGNKVTVYRKNNLNYKAVPVGDWIKITWTEGGEHHEITVSYKEFTNETSN